MKDFTTAGPREPRRIPVETRMPLAPVKDSLTTGPEPTLLQAVDAFVEAIRADDLKSTRQTFLAMIDAADVARGNA